MFLLSLRLIASPKVKRLLPTLLLAAGLCPVVTSAADMPKAFRERMGGDPDRDVVDSLDFIMSLSLTDKQAWAILPLYEEACRLHTDHYREQAEILPLEIEAYTAFLAEDRLNQGFTPEVERATGRIHRRAREAREALVTGLNALADEVRQVLTTDQRRIADAYRPNKKAVFERFASPKERRRAAHRAERKARRGAPRPDPGDPVLADVRKELEAINRAVHPRPDAVAKYVLMPAAAHPLYARADTRLPRAVREAVQCRQSGTKEYPRARYEQDQQTLRALRREINNWNLANGMHFDREQIERLVSLANEAERLRTTQRQAKPKKRLPRKTFNAELVRLELAAESVLRQGQLEVLETYKPCLLPPKNLKDPVRVGQASDSTRMVRWLDRARRKPDRQVERMVDRLIKVETTHIGPMDEAALERRRGLLRETVRRAAEMSDVEFALNQDDLADAIRRADRKNELLDDINVLRRERAEPGRTAQFLLNRGFAAVLEQRYAQLSP